MSADENFILMQKLKCLSRVSFMAFIYQHKPDPPSAILAWLFEKSIDLVDGIIQLHKSNLDECSQSLIRVLFETYLKYVHFIALMKITSPKEATTHVIASIVIMKEKDTLAQDKSLSGESFTMLLGNVKELKEKYSKQDIKKIKRYGFLLESIESIARKYNKTPEYEMMYRNFSRNIHANDYAEYYRKQGGLQKNNYVESRNLAAFGFTLRIFIEMMGHMNHIFGLNMDNELNNIVEEYSKLDES